MKAPIIISIVLAAFGLFTGVYLVGSFCEASFDIREWNGGFRWFIGLIGGVASATIAVASHAQHFQDKQP
jgi:hypothetical protein